MPAIVAFTALLMLLECALAAVHLAPPTNVTVNCTDSRASVHWRYAEDADVSFWVYVDDSEPHETTRHSYENLSAWVWKSSESAMDVHYVSVAAAVPDGPSSPQITFTYNSFRLAEVECKLAFPDVDVKADDGSAIVSFPNPLRHDPQLRHAIRGAATLEFNATYDSGEVKAVCEPYQNVCRKDVTFSPGSAECVTLKGWLSDPVSGRLDFGPSRRTCVKRSSGRETLFIVLPSVLVVATLLICVVAVVAWRPLAKARKEPLPKCLEVAKLTLHARVGCCEADGCAGHHRLISVDDFSLSVSTEMESLPLHLEEEVQEEEEQEVEDDDEEGCWASNYDCSHGNMVDLDMGDGDQAVGYMER
ncbi:interferon gamma receptor 1-like [Syngnathus typhle]|uniref:interferon gamma receptor 1-like n=1 Tax=Syngnathus typhle TaxID=161592 RepID=UPI002A6AEBF8|nr:interferon gamma receptor 1-like [Syngnathus typhle]XP_061130223.1 interferon gamma receptor 1-like [Syngnathus typhle]